jgi:hypothetical protein
MSSGVNVVCAILPVRNLSATLFGDGSASFLISSSAAAASHILCNNMSIIFSIMNVNVVPANKHEVVATLIHANKMTICYKSKHLSRVTAKDKIFPLTLEL